MLLPSRPFPELLSRFPDYLRDRKPLQITRLGKACPLNHRIAEPHEIERLVAVFSVSEHAIIAARHRQPMLYAFVLQWKSLDCIRIAEMLCDETSDIERAIGVIFEMADYFWKRSVSRIIFPSEYKLEIDRPSVSLPDDVFIIEQ